MMRTHDIYMNIADQMSYDKWTVPIIASIFTLPISEFFSRYIFDDWRFLVFLVILIALDTLTGVLKAWKRKAISSDGFIGVILKTFVYAVFVIVLHILESFSEEEAIKTAFSWVGTLGYSAVIVRESISIIENLGVIYPTAIPTWILAKLKGFDSTGKLGGNAD